MNIVLVLIHNSTHSLWLAFLGSLFCAKSFCPSLWIFFSPLLLKEQQQEVLFINKRALVLSFNGLLRLIDMLLMATYVYPHHSLTGSALWRLGPFLKGLVNEVLVFFLRSNAPTEWRTEISIILKNVNFPVMTFGNLRLNYTKWTLFCKYYLKYNSCQNLL